MSCSLPNGFMKIGPLEPAKHLGHLHAPGKTGALAVDHIGDEFDADTGGSDQRQSGAWLILTMAGLWWLWD